METPCYSCSRHQDGFICVCSNKKKRKEWNNTDKLKYLYECCYSIISDNIKRK